MRKDSHQGLTFLGQAVQMGVQGSPSGEEVCLRAAVPLLLITGRQMHSQSQDGTNRVFQHVRYVGQA